MSEFEKNNNKQNNNNNNNNKSNSSNYQTKLIPIHFRIIAVLGFLENAVYSIR